MLLFQSLLNTAVTMNLCYGPTMLNIKIIVLWDQGHLQKFKADCSAVDTCWNKLKLNEIIRCARKVPL